MPVRRAPRCPPGVWCLTSGVGISILVVSLIAGFFLYRYWLNESDSKPLAPITIVQKEAQIQEQPIQIFNSQNGDGRYTRAPEPYRMWATSPDLRGAILPPGAIPINQPTRWLPEQFQQSGILKTPDQQILPLFGRRTGSSTDRYQYYTRTDTYNPIQVPISYQRRDCMEDVGCSELTGGETIQIRGLDKSANVEVYKFDAPKYIPGIL